MKGNIEIYQSEDHQIILDVNLVDDSVWLSQEQMALLFDRDRTVIGRHIRNIFKEEELDEEMVCAKNAHTTKHGAIDGKTQRQSRNIYNLDVIISVGYRVKSFRGTQFRIWATQKLKELMQQGYVLNEKRPAQKEQEVKFEVGYSDLKSGHRAKGRGGRLRLARYIREGLGAAR